MSRRSLCRYQAYAAMNFKTRRFLGISLLCLTIVFVLLIWTIIFSSQNVLFRLKSSHHSQDPPRGVIVTLVRSTNRSVMLTINMIHSITRFYNTNRTRSHPILIFHDDNFTSTMRDRILSCVLKANKNLNISFVLADFHASPTLIDPRSRLEHPIGYRLMCRFWSRDVFFHPIIVRGQFDYLMRLDADSYFSGPVQEDLFSFMDRENLDYIYRAWYSESSAPMLPVEKLFLWYRFFDRTQCIYNNFFVIRLQWFYESERVQSFLRELVRDDRMLRQYIGDGCVHAAMLSIDGNVKAKQVTHISYGHNYHTMDANRYYIMFTEIDGFYDGIDNSCEQLTLIHGVGHQLIRIKMLEEESK